MTELNEQEIAKKLEEMRIDAILDLHEWTSTKGCGIIINKDGSVYDYNWFLGFNTKTNTFGMCTKLDKRDKIINCDEIKKYLKKDLMIFDKDYDNDFREDGGYDIIIKIDNRNKYSNNNKLYKQVLKKIKDIYND